MPAKNSEPWKMNPLDSNDKGLIELQRYKNDAWSGSSFGYKMSKLLDNMLLVTYMDESKDGQSIVRRGIHIPIDHVLKAWRIGQVILAGPDCKQVKLGDYICFPNDKGLPVTNIDVDGEGVVKKAIFLDEDRIFKYKKDENVELPTKLS